MDSLESLFSLRGHRGLVTGASSGLGVECAKALAIAGADVALVARRIDRVTKFAAELARAHGVKTIGIGADVTREPDLDRVMAEATAAIGDVDILVNNAGVSPTGRAENFKREAWDEAIAVNLTAPMMLAQRVARLADRDREAGPHHQHGFDLRVGGEFGVPAVGIRGDQGCLGESDTSARGRMGRLMEFWSTQSRRDGFPPRRPKAVSRSPRTKSGWRPSRR